ncbi:helix-turn-helix transcriptional regulator [Paratissierella segnis]|uniref:Transcriptional regulator n=1 Tax=Paratissierella segnis TaxID=2763679 RepID=A0A926EWY7_9FIRM|nr:transcriptional regulator [Paratissierella segnis]MBC8587959.1 transcriptional regulator [Paratissierella segnis]
MSKLSNILNMYLLIQGRGIIKVKELAEIIEVSPRMIKQYKDDLEQAGIYIGSKRGRYGGYYLENGIDLKELSIKKEELESLKMANEIIKSGNYLFSSDFEIFTYKMLNYQNDFEGVDFFTKDSFKPLAMKEKERQNWNIIKKAIINKRKVKMSYKPIKSDGNQKELSTRIVHPYGTFSHKGAIYFFGYCEMRKEVRYFKLSRIESLDLLNQKFSINIKYDFKSTIRKSFGIIDDDLFHLKLKISYPMSQLVKEKQYSINQSIVEIDEDTIIFEADLKGYKEVKSWVMSMGKHAEVMEPEKLREDIIEEIKILGEMYDK